MTAPETPDLATGRAQLDADRATLARERAAFYAEQAVADLAPRLGFRNATTAYRLLDLDELDPDPETARPRNVLEPLQRLAREMPELIGPAVRR